MYCLLLEFSIKQSLCNRKKYEKWVSGEITVESRENKVHARNKLTSKRKGGIYAHHLNYE